MSLPFPSPTIPVASRVEIFLGYIEFFRERLVEKIEMMPEQARVTSGLPSGWTPLELLKHLTYVERRWLEWGFEGRAVPDPWGDQEDGRWRLSPGESMADLVADLTAQAARSRAVVLAHPLDEVGQPGPRWDGAEPASLERVIFHLVQEYARHLGQLDIVAELAGGDIGE